MKAKRNIVVGATAAQIEAAIGVTPEDRKIVREILAHGHEPRAARARLSRRRGTPKPKDALGASTTAARD